MTGVFPSKMSRFFPKAFVIFLLAFCGQGQREAGKPSKPVPEELAFAVARVMSGSGALFSMLSNYYNMLFVGYLNFTREGTECIFPSFEPFYNLVLGGRGEPIESFEDSDFDFIPDVRTTLSFSNCSARMNEFFVSITGNVNVLDGNPSTNFLFGVTGDWGGYSLEFDKFTFSLSSTDNIFFTLTFSGSVIAYSTGDLDLDVAGTGDVIDFEGAGNFKIQKFEYFFEFENDARNKDSDTDCSPRDGVSVPFDTGTWKISRVLFLLSWKGESYELEGGGYVKVGCEGGISLPEDGKIELSDGAGNTVSLILKGETVEYLFNGRRMR